MATTSASQSDLAALAASFVSFADIECPDAPLHDAGHWIEWLR
jgi:hypothetical protein